MCIRDRYLGETVADIAREKCGIIKQGGTVVAYRNGYEAASVIEQECKIKDARLVTATEAEKRIGGFYADGAEYKLSLEGAYQADNAAVVLAVIKVMRGMGVNIPEQAVRKGFAECKWSARFQHVRDNIIVDGGHNPDGIAALCRSVSQIDGKKTAVMAMMEDKAAEECMTLISEAFDEVIATELDMPRCMRAKRLAEIAERAGIRTAVFENYSEAFDVSRHKKGTVVICGSLFLAGKALDYFDGK